MRRARSRFLDEIPESQLSVVGIEDEAREAMAQKMKEEFGNRVTLARPGMKLDA